MGSKLAYKILVQLIEADVEIGFALVDEAKAYRAWGRPDCSSRVLQVAEDTVDIKFPEIKIFPSACRIPVWPFVVVVKAGREPPFPPLSVFLVRVDKWSGGTPAKHI